MKTKDLQEVLDKVAAKYNTTARIMEPGQYTREGAEKRAEICRKEAEKFNRPNASKCSKLRHKALLDEAEAMEMFYQSGNRVD